jgi:hypothetical protein
MSPRVRGLMAIAIAAIMFLALTWFDAVVLASGQAEAQATFNVGYVWLSALGALAIAAAVILFATLAWWSRSFVASLVFLAAGGVGILVSPVLFTFPGDWPYYLNMTLSWWLSTTSGPLHAAALLDAALLVAGLIGFYRWAFTRRLAVVDR